MILPSRLSATTLGDLLGMLHRERTTGTLELTEPWLSPGSNAGHYIHLRCGLVWDVTTPLKKTPPLGEFLWREGFLANSAHRALLRHLGLHDLRQTGEILVAERLADAAVVEAALRVQVKLKLDALFSLNDALVTFHAAGAPRRHARRIHPLTPKDFLVGKPRARDRVPTSEVRPKTRSAPADVFRTYEVHQSKPPPRANDTYARTHADTSSSSGRHKSSSKFLHLAPDVRQRALGKLGLPLTADESDVKRAFRKLAVELHPDKHATAPAAHRDRNAAKFAEISEAYHLLVA